MSLLLPGLVKAENTLEPFVSLITVQDNNLYRLDSAIDEALLPSTLSKSDTIYQTAVGLNLDWTVSRQQFLVNASMVDSRFDKNDSLDNMGQNLDAKWNWLVGSHVTGQVGVTNKKTLADLANTVSREGSEHTVQKMFASSNWRFHPDWRIGLGVSDYDSSYDTQAQQVLDRKDLSQSVNLDYLANSGSRVGLKFIQQDSQLPNRVVTESSTIDNEYTQQSMLVTTLWTVTGKSRLNAEAGLVNRHYLSISDRDYDGLNLKVDYDWFPTGKFIVNLGARRQIVSSDNLDSNYSENTAFNLNANWLYTDKVIFTSQIKQEQRDYAVDSGGSSTLKETYDTLSVGVNYKPHRNFDVGFNYTQSQRDSTQLFRDYESDMLSLSLTITL